MDMITKKKSVAILALSAGIGLSSQSYATVFYGKMTGTITAEQSLAPPGIPGQTFDQWIGVGNSAIGQSVELDFLVYDQTVAAGSATPIPWPVSNDPQHQGDYATGNLFYTNYGVQVSAVLLGGRSLVNPSPTDHIAQNNEKVINDIAPGDQFSWSTSYPVFTQGSTLVNGNAYLANFGFSLLTQQNILNSGAAQQEFYWLSSNDPGASASGSFQTSRYLPISMRASYTFSVDRVSLSASSNPAPPQPVPISTAAWLFGSSLIGLADAARRRKSA